MNRITRIAAIAVTAGALALGGGALAASAAPSPYQLAVWLIPGGDASNAFATPQTLVSDTGEATATLDATINCAPTAETYQVDLYNTSDTTTSLIRGGILTAPNNPTEDLATGALGQGVDPWKYVTIPACPAAAPVTVAESGTGTGTVVTCDPTSVNSIELDAVPGGVWHVSNPGNSGNSLPIGVGLPVTTGAGGNGYVDYTFTLSDGDATDGYSVTPYSFDWTPVDPSTVTQPCPVVTAPPAAPADPAAQLGATLAFTGMSGAQLVGTVIASFIALLLILAGVTVILVRRKRAQGLPE